MLLAETSTHGDILFSFLGILFEGAPYILLGTIISGLIDAYLPPGLLEKLMPRRPVLAILMSGLLGAFLPVCECAIVPVIRRLLAKGLPLASAVTYMLAAPIVNPITALSTWRAFSGRAPDHPERASMMITSRLLMAYIVCVGVGFIVHRFKPQRLLTRKLARQVDEKEAEMAVANRAERTADEDVEPQNHADHGHGSRILVAARTAQRDFLDVLIYFSIGALLTATFVTQFEQKAVESFAGGFAEGSGAWGNDALAVIVMMVLAFFLSLCSTSDAFVAAQMLPFSIGSKLSFLVYGPMMDLKLVFMYMSVFRKKVVVALAIGLFVAIAFLSMTWTYITNEQTIRAREALATPEVFQK